VREGQLVRRGTLFARASDSGAPDGCHLHFEKRAIGGGLSTASSPRALVALAPRRR
jgi:murein DD-endopeptidase MepM/ murein hydrolase activator NlpD